ncbi:MAG: efflux transporter periplasmic adaptor subunit, partial [Phycisphaerae bacterium]
MLNNDVKVGRLRRKPLRTVGIITLAVSVCLIVVWLKVVGGNNVPANNLATFVARRGRLTISVLESGTIQSREQIILRNEVEGRTSVVSIVPDGGSVKAGDLLVELDASTLKDAVIDQDIQVQRAEAAYVSAQETLAVVENQAVSDVNLAELTLEFAIQDLDQYKEGQFPNEETAAKNEITLAREELTRAEETLNWSKTLYERKYISHTELQADELAVTRGKNKLQLAENNLELLQNFTYHRNMAQLESDFRQAEMALERTKRKARADVIQAKADLKAKDLEYQRHQDKLKKIADQLEKTKIYAPQDGMVVYATTS